MRKSRAETAETHALILDTAAREFRKNGIAETGLLDVMKAAGLTQGGFYRHFDSKDELVCESLQGAFDELFDAMESRGVGATEHDAMAAIVSHYLSPKQRDQFENACPLAALGSDLRRADNKTKGVASEGLDRFVNVIRKRLGGMPPREAKARAMAIVSAMVGSMLLARLTNSTTVSNSILKDTRDFILQS